MALIKHSQAASVTRDALVLDLGDLRAQADRILADARAQAERIRRDAKAEATRLTERAAEDGRAAGHAEGLEAGRAEGREAAHAEAVEEFRAQFDALTRDWQAALDRWNRDRNRMMLEAREDVIRLALAVARKIVHRHVDVDPAVVEDQIVEALRLVSEPGRLVVRVHRDERERVESVLPDLLQTLDEDRDVCVVDDDSVEPGGCIVATAGGEIDATLKTQLDRIARALLPGDGHRLGPPAAKALRPAS